MFLKIDAGNRIGERVALRSMFEDRRRVFVDWLKWDLFVLDGRYEIDRFDDRHAIYIALVDQNRKHLASARLLPTTRPGILNSLYAHLALEPIPVSDRAYEITRFCLSPDLQAGKRRRCRDALVSELARFALERGIDTYTALAALPWLRQICAFGWDCSLLGPLQRDGKAMLGAFRIDIDKTSIAKLETAGIHGLDGAGRRRVRAA